MSTIPAAQVVEHEIRVAASVEAALAAITTDDGLSSWYGAGMASTDGGGDVVFQVGRHPLFHWRVAREDNRVVWTCVEGPGQSVGTEAVYEILVGDDGRTTVRLTHRGWDEGDDAFRRCNTYWGALLFQLQRFLETGERRPVFS